MTAPIDRMRDQPPAHLAHRGDAPHARRVAETIDAWRADYERHSAIYARREALRLVRGGAA
jgi:hypothetical protein